MAHAFLSFHETSPQTRPYPRGRYPGPLRTTALLSTSDNTNRLPKRCPGRRAWRYVAPLPSLNQGYRHKKVAIPCALASAQALAGSCRAIAGTITYARSRGHS
ncbi:hypothetical protein Bbelb_367560 [Branchiostoma belcheri]|nr:hypothetical protein Bbelb_367560 [Branchiostoma belcheri]